MANLGAYPIDESTPVGMFRSEIGDTNGTPHQPDDGKADYEYISDAAIQAYIDRYPGDNASAMADALNTMSRRLIIAAQDIQVDDIKIKTLEKARLFEEHAIRIATGAAAGSGDGFGVVALHTTQSEGWSAPQGTPWPETL